MYSETAGRTLLRYAKTIPPRGDGGRAAAIHYAMFKMASSNHFANVTGIEVAAGLGINDSYKSEWPKIVNLVAILREKGEI